MGHKSRVVSLLVAGVALLAVGSASARPGTPRYGRLAGVPALPQGARVLGALAPQTRLRLTISLRPRDGAALTRFSAAVSTPGSGSFRHYLTPGEFARRFGAQPEDVDAVNRFLRARGLIPGRVSSNRLSLPLVASAARVERAFSTGLVRVRLASGRVAYANTRGPLLTRLAAGSVQAVMGLDSLGLYQLGGPPRLRAASAPPQGHVVTGGPQPCPAIAQEFAHTTSYTADQIASAYRLSSMYQAGDLGAGQTVALLEGEPETVKDIARFQACYGTHTVVTNIKVHGGARSQQSGEAALDIETVIGLAPQAHVLVYQMPQLSTPDVYDTLTTAVTQNRAQVISASFGVCERNVNKSFTATENVLYEEAATQGQSMFAATGDFGANSCITNSGLPTGRLAVSDPASQPYVTAVGGTTLSTFGPPPHERVWDDPSSRAGGGGGVSTQWRMPAYQSLAPDRVHVINPQSSAHQCHAPHGGYCREIPDVVADGDPNTGYVLYFDGWTVGAGTSFSAPLWASLAALVEGSSACDGRRIGFLNPSLYQAAARNYSRYFNDIRSGSNSIGFGGFDARLRYDMASGLGTPDGATLPAALCQLGTGPLPSATIVSPRGGRYYAVGQRIRTSFHCSDPGGPGLYSCLDCVGAPSPSGRLKTAAPGRKSYTATAVTRWGQVAEDVIRYTVAGRPSVRVSVPRPGRHYRLGQRVPTRFHCREGSYGPGLASCRDSAGSGSPGRLDTGRMGSFTYRVTAVSRDRQRRTVSVSYRVVR